MKICVFASGAGTNFKAIIGSVKKGIIHSEISLLISNNPDCNAVKIARKHKINFEIINKNLFDDFPKSKISGLYLNTLKKYKIDFIVLAGFTQYIPAEVIKKYRDKIINIHPALLPAFGGKGMYGMKVHKAVIESGVKVSGITIHFVNEIYDEGKIIFQKCLNVGNDDDEFLLRKRIQKLEHRYYPLIIKKFEDGKIRVSKGKVKIFT